MKDQKYEIIDQKVNEVFTFTTNIDVQMLQCVYMTRISHRREDTESKVSPEDFVQGLINSRHYEPLEFVTIYANLKDEYFSSLRSFLLRRTVNPEDSHVRRYGNLYVFTLRELVEYYDKSVNEEYKFSLHSELWTRVKNKIVHDCTLRDIINTSDEIKRSLIRVKFIVTTNRQIATEITRHRCLSKNWESTRYCIYNKDFFKSKLIICNPELFEKIHKNTLTPLDNTFLDFISSNADMYMLLASENTVQAAYSLPSDIATKVAFAAYMNDLDVVIKKRITNYCGKPHKDAHALMTLVRNEVYDMYNTLYLDDNDQTVRKTNNTTSNNEEIENAKYITSLNIDSEAKEKLLKMLADRCSHSKDNAHTYSKEVENEPHAKSFDPNAIAIKRVGRSENSETQSDDQECRVNSDKYTSEQNRKCNCDDEHLNDEITELLRYIFSNLNRLHRI